MVSSTNWRRISRPCGNKRVFGKAEIGDIFEKNVASEPGTMRLP
ncbi:hypothetical protein PpBr36_08556 [Pyricularia pennisetigena]|nr:hypothetical protein PpBr36_08556 [Pyricularia pennisetigena]TLS24932.1 hypothetical protein PpBr36_08556 [Pyricularia pennisetigena]